MASMKKDEQPAYCVLGFDCQRSPYSEQYIQTNETWKPSDNRTLPVDSSRTANSWHITS